MSNNIYKWTSVRCECLFNRLFLARQRGFSGYPMIKYVKMMAIPIKIAVDRYMVR